eukprot:GHVO01029434.1.p1 GENE.GHVO01029434.1~~GHVO01029434.1.p1  ORF type:complete len:189 (+),score=36.62 GHVO01029434.1:4-570(+)
MSIITMLLRRYVGSVGYTYAPQAMYKPKAWIKGILLPLALDECTLKEAVIIGSVMAKLSLPPLHAAAALVRLSEIRPWCAANEILISVIVDKKYNMPFSVVNRLVDHYTSFMYDDRVLPVLWHRGLLIFGQRFKAYITSEQRSRLRVLLAKHFHPQMTPEIRREMFDAPVTRLADAAAKLEAQMTVDA